MNVLISPYFFAKGLFGECFILTLLLSLKIGYNSFMDKGKLTQNGVHLLDHEWKTVKYFLEFGKDIELLPKSEIKNYHQGDFMMDGIPWEAKAPVGKGKYTVQNKIQEAVQQSCNIIIDLRRSKMLEEKAIKAYEREFYNSKGLRRMKIIKKDGDLLDFRK